MSANLWMLIVLQGSTLTFSPGYATLKECQAVYQGPNVICSEYDPNGLTWTAVFKTPYGGFGSVYRFESESRCKDYIGAMRSDIPAACRQMAHPETCPVACRAPAELPAPLFQLPPPKPDSFSDVLVGPSKLAERDVPTIDPYIPAPSVRKEKARNRYARTSATLRRPASTGPAMYDDKYYANPFTLIASLFTGSW
jgi:hypothetical protein